MMLLHVHTSSFLGGVEPEREGGGGARDFNIVTMLNPVKHFSYHVSFCRHIYFKTTTELINDTS